MAGKTVYFAFSEEAGNTMTTVYASDIALGIPHQLSFGAFALPNLVAGYQVDLEAEIAERSYAVSGGSMTFTTACETGASGTVQDAEFSEVDLSDDFPVLVPNGCTMSYAQLDFAIGSCPTP